MQPVPQCDHWIQGNRVRLAGVDVQRLERCSGDSYRCGALAPAGGLLRTAELTL